MPTASNTASSLPTLRLPADICKPDKGQWTNRFEVRSSSSSSVYIVSQHKTGRYWGCNCKGYVFAKKTAKRGKTCKHITTLGLAIYGECYVPVEVTIEPVAA